MDPLCDELQATWHQGIPISKAMGVEVADYAAGTLSVSASLAANVNVHATAFAGSLYAICTLTAWGRLWLELRGRGLDADIVLAEGRIRYHSPVAEDIVCRCALDVEAQQGGLDRLTRAGRAGFTLACTAGTGGRPAVEFTGRFAARLQPPVRTLPPAPGTR